MKKSIVLLLVAALMLTSCGSPKINTESVSKEVEKVTEKVNKADDVKDLTETVASEVKEDIKDTFESLELPEVNKTDAYAQFPELNVPNDDANYRTELAEGQSCLAGTSGTLAELGVIKWSEEYFGRIKSENPDWFDNYCVNPTSEDLANGKRKDFRLEYGFAGMFIENDWNNPDSSFFEVLKKNKYPDCDVEGWPVYREIKNYDNCILPFNLTPDAFIAYTIDEKFFNNTIAEFFGKDALYSNILFAEDENELIKDWILVYRNYFERVYDRWLDTDDEFCIDVWRRELSDECSYKALTGNNPYWK